MGRSNMLNFQYRNIFIIICSVALTLALFGCGAGEKQNEQLDWTVSVQDFQVKNVLENTDDVRQYDGSIAKVAHKNEPSAGNVFVLINLDVKKNVSGNHPFIWQNVVLQDADGNAYERAKDVFLTDYKYDRLSATDLKLDAKGWVCYEVPSDVANKEMKLVYKENDKENVISIKK